MKCQGAVVEPRTDLRAVADFSNNLNGTSHAGSIIHVCVLKADEHTVCVCQCGKRFFKTFKGVTQ